MADLRVDGIHTAYGLSQVLFGVSLDVRAGECIALIGRNGVGKTTTMRSIIGLTLLFTEHDMSVVFGIAERISVLHHGEIIASGAPDAVRNDPEVKRVYLGDGHG